jgi:hypothetical protein
VRSARNRIDPTHAARALSYISNVPGDSYNIRQTQSRVTAARDRGCLIRGRRVRSDHALTFSTVWVLTIGFLSITVSSNSRDRCSRPSLERMSPSATTEEQGQTEKEKGRDTAEVMEFVARAASALIRLAPKRLAGITNHDDAHSCAWRTPTRPS